MYTDVLYVRRIASALEYIRRVSRHYLTNGDSNVGEYDGFGDYTVGSAAGGEQGVHTRSLCMILACPVFGFSKCVLCVGESDEERGRGGRAPVHLS